MSTVITTDFVTVEQLDSHTLDIQLVVTYDVCHLIYTNISIPIYYPDHIFTTTIAISTTLTTIPSRFTHHAEMK